MDSNGNKIAPTRRYHGAFSVTTFDNVGEYFTSTAQRGRRFVTLNEEEYITVCIDTIDGLLQKKDNDVLYCQGRAVNTFVFQYYYLS